MQPSDYKAQGFDPETHVLMSNPHGRVFALWYPIEPSPIGTHREAEIS